MILGAHEGVAGGVSMAFARAEEDGADSIQIFTKSARGWDAKPLDPDEVRRFRAEARRTGKPVAAQPFHGRSLEVHKVRTRRPHVRHPVRPVRA